MNVTGNVQGFTAPAIGGVIKRVTEKVALAAAEDIAEHDETVEVEEDEALEPKKVVEECMKFLSEHFSSNTTLGRLVKVRSQIQEALSSEKDPDILKGVFDAAKSHVLSIPPARIRLAYEAAMRQWGELFPGESEILPSRLDILVEAWLRGEILEGVKLQKNLISESLADSVTKSIEGSIQDAVEAVEDASKDDGSSSDPAENDDDVTGKPEQPVGQSEEPEEAFESQVPYELLPVVLQRAHSLLEQFAHSNFSDPRMVDAVKDWGFPQLFVEKNLPRVDESRAFFESAKELLNGPPRDVAGECERICNEFLQGEREWTAEPSIEVILYVFEAENKLRALLPTEDQR